MPKRIVLAGITATLVTAGIIGGLATTATATSTPNSVITHTSVSYTSPSEVSSPVHRLYQGERVDGLCHVTAEEVRGNATWIKIKHDGIQSWVHKDLIQVPRNLPNC